MICDLDFGRIALLGFPKYLLTYKRNGYQGISVARRSMKNQDDYALPKICQVSAISFSLLVSRPNPTPSDS